MAEAVWKTALQDGQDAGTAVIYAEAKLGELLAAIPPKKGKTKQYGSSGGTIPSLPTGVSKRTSHQAQTMAILSWMKMTKRFAPQKVFLLGSNRMNASEGFSFFTIHIGILATCQSEGSGTDSRCLGESDKPYRQQIDGID